MKHTNTCMIRWYLPLMIHRTCNRCKYAFQARFTINYSQWILLYFAGLVVLLLAWYNHIHPHIINHAEKWICRQIKGTTPTFNEYIESLGRSMNNSGCELLIMGARFSDHDPLISCHDIEYIIGQVYHLWNVNVPIDDEWDSKHAPIQDQ